METNGRGDSAAAAAAEVTMMVHDGLIRWIVVRGGTVHPSVALVDPDDGAVVVLKLDVSNHK